MKKVKRKITVYAQYDKETRIRSFFVKDNKDRIFSLVEYIAKNPNMTGMVFKEYLKLTLPDNIRQRENLENRDLTPEEIEMIRKSIEPLSQEAQRDMDEQIWTEYFKRR